MKTQDRVTMKSARTVTFAQLIQFVYKTFPKKKAPQVVNKMFESGTATFQNPTLAKRCLQTSN